MNVPRFVHVHDACKSNFQKLFSRIFTRLFLSKKIIGDCNSHLISQHNEMTTSKSLRYKNNKHKKKKSTRDLCGLVDQSRTMSVGITIEIH